MIHWRAIAEAAHDTKDVQQAIVVALKQAYVFGYNDGHKDGAAQPNHNRRNGDGTDPDQG